MPFKSNEFRIFAKDLDFNIQTSSPKSHGLAEKSVGICEKILRKYVDSDGDVQKALLEYRTSPLTGLNVSPSELLNNRVLRTTLPITQNVLKSKPEINYNKINNQRKRSKCYYDRQAQSRLEFKKGDSVILREEKYWVPAEILRKDKSPRDNCGRIFRRNSSFIRPFPNLYTRENDSTVFEDMFNESTLDNNSLTTTETNKPSNSRQNNFSSENCIKTRSGRIIVKPARYKE